MVYAGIWLLDGARDRVEGMASLIEPFSFLPIAGLCLMLFWRGIRHFGAEQSGHHHHDHDHSEHCDCGHSHGPDPVKAIAAGTWREASVLILGIALRPCASALFLLILTWRYDLDVIGIVGAFVMGLGTMMLTVSAAIPAVMTRRGILLSLPQGNGPALALATIELVVGTAVFLAAGLAALKMM